MEMIGEWEGLWTSLSSTPELIAPPPPWRRAKAGGGSLIKLLRMSSACTAHLSAREGTSCSWIGHWPARPFYPSAGQPAGTFCVCFWRKCSGEQFASQCLERTAWVHPTLFAWAGALQLLAEHVCTHALPVKMERLRNRINVQREENRCMNVWMEAQHYRGAFLQPVLSGLTYKLWSVTMSLRDKLHKVTWTTILEEWNLHHIYWNKTNY